MDLFCELLFKTIFISLTLMLRKKYVNKEKVVYLFFLSNFAQGQIIIIFFFKFRSDLNLELKHSEAFM